MTGFMCLTLCVLSAASTPAAQPKLYVLKTATPAWDIVTTDLNGDSRNDILAICCDSEGESLRKSVEVFLANESGGYTEKASFVLGLDPGVGAAFLAEMDSQPPAELVAVHARGASLFAFRDGRFAPNGQADFSSLWPSRVKKPVFLTHTASDLTGDGRDEWLVPVSSGYAVRGTDGTMAGIECDVVSRISDSHTISHRLPDPYPFQAPGDTAKSIAFLSEENVDFAHGPSWSQVERHPIPLALKDKWDVSTEMKDIDGNGLPDLVVTQMQGKVNLKVLMQVYLATAPYTFPKEPTSSFEISGALTAPLLEDVNGDGKSDLLMLKVPLGVKLFVNYFVMQKLTVQAEVHLFNGATFNEEPDFRNSITVDAPERRERPAYAMGDFSGDGRTDVAFSASVDSMAVYIGSEDRFMSAKPWVSLAFPSYGVARSYDLNGNAAKDIVVFHPEGESTRRIDVAVF